MAYDFDDTVCPNTIDEGLYPLCSDEEIPHAIETIHWLQEEPRIFTLLFTCREGEALLNALDFLHQRGCHPDCVNQDANMDGWTHGKPRKPFYDIIIDDKNSGESSPPDWLRLRRIVMEKLESGIFVPHSFTIALREEDQYLLG